MVSCYLGQYERGFPTAVLYAAMRSLQTSLFNLFSGALFNVMMKMLLSSPVRSSVTYREVMVAYPTFPKALKKVAYIECYALTYILALCVYQ